MGHGDCFQIKIRKNCKWKTLPYHCASRAQANGILVRYVNVEYMLFLNGSLIDYRKLSKSGLLARSIRRDSQV